jgi:lipoate-protein ligase A
MDMLNTHQWGLVRRPTGGKAILHADELTYSVTASDKNKILSGSVLGSYQRLSLALLKGLDAIGIIADSKPKEQRIQGSQISSVCFQQPSDYEITNNRKKLIGSAQARKKGGVLQHGTIPLYGRISRIIDVLAYSSEQERELAETGLRQRATTIEEILNRKIDWMEMASAIRLGFEEMLNLQFVTSDLNDFETRRVQQLLEEKYSSDQWTKRI